PPPRPAVNPPTATTRRTVASQPYAWPYNGDIDPAHTALMVFTGDSPGEPPLGPMHTLADLASKLKAAGVRLVHLPREGAAVASLPFVPDLTVVRPKLG